ncbi:MAG: HAD family phosphatase [Candidatus Woesearchaeota archaeon]|jgi:beta-phosphoglucomutase|nr:HAD family phosphatase [Candidatus Woesearchaeota archaeon]
MNKKKYILFDMDGVLIDSMKCHVGAWKKALSEFGINVSDDDLFHLGGVSFVDTVSILSKKYNKNFSDLELLKIKKSKIAHFNRDYHVSVFDGVFENLNKLKTRGVKMCIVSGAIRQVVDRVVLENFKDMFDFLISADDVTQGKPNPEPYLMAQKKFKAQGEECVIIEDAPSGILAGNRAGIDVFALTTTLKKKELTNANKIFESHKDLFDYILKF